MSRATLDPLDIQASRAGRRHRAAASVARAMAGAAFLAALLTAVACAPPSSSTAPREAAPTAVATVKQELGFAREIAAADWAACNAVGPEALRKGVELIASPAAQPADDPDWRAIDLAIVNHNPTPIILRSLSCSGLDWGLDNPLLRIASVHGCHKNIPVALKLEGGARASETLIVSRDDGWGRAATLRLGFHLMLVCDQGKLFGLGASEANRLWSNPLTIK